MCGLIGAINHGPAIHGEYNFGPKRWVMERLQDQLERGTEGFGTVIIKADKTYTIYRACEISLANIDLALSNEDIIFHHHRNPTSSENKISQTHPISIKHGSLKHDYLVMHNGVCRNADELKKFHEDNLGFVYSTDRIRKWYNREEPEYNDSESFAIELARRIEGQTREIQINGTAAFIAIQIDKEKDKVTKIFYGRKDKELNLAVGTGKIRISSEGEGNLVKENMLYSFELGEYKISKQKLHFAKPKEEEEEEEKEEDKDEKPIGSYSRPRIVNGFEYNDIPTETYDYNDEVVKQVEENEEQAVELVQELFHIIKDDDTFYKYDISFLIKQTLKDVAKQLKEANNKAKTWRLENAQETADSLLDEGKYHSR